MANKENENREIKNKEIVDREIAYKSENSDMFVEIIDIDSNGFVKEEIQDAGEKDAEFLDAESKDIEDDNKDSDNQTIEKVVDENKENNTNDISDDKGDIAEHSEDEKTEDSSKETDNAESLGKDEKAEDSSKETDNAESLEIDEKIDDSSDEEDAEGLAKAAKKEKFWKAFDIGQIVAIIVLLFVALFGTYKLYQNMTAVRLTRALALAQAAQNDGDYATAIDYYEQAISIDSKSVIAYEELANCYATLNDTDNVMNVLYSGWKNIGDQSMLDNYISLKLNDVIATIQTSGGSFEAVEEVLDVLKIDGANEDALQLLGTLYSYCMIDKNTSGDNVLFWEDDDENSSFAKYKEAVSSMLDIYEVSPSEELEMLISRYIIPEGNVVWIGLDNCSDYALLIQDASNLLGESSSLDSFIGCLENAVVAQGVFDKIWPEIEDGDIEPFRDFMISDEILSYKDALINGEDPYLEIEMENAFCQEGIILTLLDNSWTYHFLDYSENNNTNGVITLQLTYEEVQASKTAVEEAVENEDLEAADEVTEDESQEASTASISEDTAVAEESESTQESLEESDVYSEESLEEEEIIVGSISMNYEPSVTGGKYFPHVTYYMTCDYEGEIVTYTYQKVITIEDGTKTRTTVENWGDEELETIADESVEEETETTTQDTTTQQTQTQDDSASTENTSNVIVDPETGAMIDATTGLEIDPATGFLKDPATGLYIDPNTWTYIDPATGAVVDPNAASADQTTTDQTQTTTDSAATAVTN